MIDRLNRGWNVSLGAGGREMETRVDLGVHQQNAPPTR